MAGGGPRRKPSERLPGKQPAQGQVADKASQNHGCQVQKVSCGRTYGEGNLVENNLSVWIIGADIKHIGIAVGMGSHIYERGYAYAGQNRGSMDTKSPGVLPPSPVMAQYRPMKMSMKCHRNPWRVKSR